MPSVFFAMQLVWLHESCRLFFQVRCLFVPEYLESRRSIESEKLLTTSSSKRSLSFCLDFDLTQKERISNGMELDTIECTLGRKYETSLHLSAKSRLHLGYHSGGHAIVLREWNNPFSVVVRSICKYSAGQVWMLNRPACWCDSYLLIN